MADIRRVYFFDREEDRRFSRRNIHFWRALIGHVEADGSTSPGAVVLDVGCHRGGLLELASQRLQPSKLIGLEPLTSARQAALEDLSNVAAEVQLFGAEDWSKLPDQSVDLALGHEVLQYISDPLSLMGELRRVLVPGGFAYLVLGCHTENPIWTNWKARLEELGHAVFDHAPLDVMTAGSHQGLATSVRPLRDTGWVHYDPVSSGDFSFPSVGVMLDHQFRHKLLFRFERR